MKKNKTRVTVAVSAFNEEKNIMPFLNSILNQKEEGFQMDKIVIHSDGSNDNTVTKIKKLKNKKIELFEHKQRLGKSYRLNEIYDDLDSDILIQTDSDVVFANRMVVANLIHPLIKNKNIGMCGGNPLPLEGQSHIELAINYTTDVYNIFRHKVGDGNNIFSADGRLLAFKKDAVKKIKIPIDMIANDTFAYLSVKKLGFKYKFVSQAIVYYRSPQTIKEHINQNSRFLASRIRMQKYFDKKNVDKEWNIPKDILLKETFKQFLNHPLFCLFIFIINRYCQYIAKISEKNLNAIWKIAGSTKKMINLYI